MLRMILILLLGFFLLATLPSCNSNKIACPTYADSFPDKKAKKGKQEPQIPKSTKAKSGLLPPNAKRVKR
ncbi:MAG: hypothetical protein V4615_07160 [Bacteroidota bacterium]